jgi:hypothetical protein
MRDGLADRCVDVYARTAAVLEHSAAIADRIAERLEQSGRSDAAREERRSSARARRAAERARSLALERRTSIGGHE